MNRVIAYLRVSKNIQETENQKYGINEYCKRTGLEITEWVEDIVTGTSEMKDRDGGNMIYDLDKGDIIIITELSRLSRKMIDMVVLIDYAAKKGIAIHTIKEGIVFKDDMTSKIMSFVFGMASDLERTRISERTKEALARKKSEGKTLGRRKGYCPSFIELDNARDYILVMLRHGIPKSKIAPFVGTNRVTFNRYIKYLEVI